jgi:hypothetical protein
MRRQAGDGKAAAVGVKLPQLRWTRGGDFRYSPPLAGSRRFPHGDPRRIRALFQMGNSYRLPSFR